MKRITIWVDCGNEKVEVARRQIESFLKSSRFVYTVVDVCELVSVNMNDK